MNFENQLKIRKLAETLVGLKYEEAIKLIEKYPIELDYRYLVFEGTPCMCTCDIRTDRVSLSVDSDGIVYEAYQD